MLLKDLENQGYEIINGYTSGKTIAIRDKGNGLFDVRVYVYYGPGSSNPGTQLFGEKTDLNTIELIKYLC